jgi:hypothetical protein
MSEELTVLKEYYQGLGLGQKELSMADVVALKNELLDAGEFGLARLVAGLSTPQELLDYVGEEE